MFRMVVLRGYFDFGCYFVPGVGSDHPITKTQWPRGLLEPREARIRARRLAGTRFRIGKRERRGPEVPVRENGLIWVGGSIRIVSGVDSGLFRELG